MTSEYYGLVGFGAALVLTLLGVPVAISMAVVGFGGFALMNGWSMGSYILGSAPFEAVFPYGLSVIPLFVAMGVFAASAGLSGSLFAAVNRLVGGMKGGLAIAAIGACALFGAICGSSLATAATMGRIAVPEMLRAGYSKSLASASVAAGGTLGVLIPPSVLIVIYALLTENSIGKLFAAALIPGLLATLLYICAVMVSVRMRPDLVGEPVADAKQPSQTGSWSVGAAMLLFIVVIGGLYVGFFSPNEAAAVGAFGAFTLAVAMGTKSRVLIEAALEVARTSAMIFMILVGAALFNFFLEGTGLTSFLSGWITGLGLSPIAVMVLIVAFYVVLGCFMDALSMILLTIPVVYPIVISLGYDPIWFGILVVSVAEIGLITPPIGMNLFVVQSVAPEVRQVDIMKGILPFILVDIIRVVIMIAFPAVILFLPGLL